VAHWTQHAERVRTGPRIGRTKSVLVRPFFFYNLSLVPIVTAIWLGLQWMVHKYYHPKTAVANSNRPIVGYFGVLFAWMVVASLEQPLTCPDIFRPSPCFPTYNWGPVKYTWGPLVQVIVKQVILSHVSLTAHMAGIVAGLLAALILLTRGFYPSSLPCPPPKLYANIDACTQRLSIIGYASYNTKDNKLTVFPPQFHLSCCSSPFANDSSQCI
jgi:hypothetical protein